MGSGPSSSMQSWDGQGARVALAWALLTAGLLALGGDTEGRGERRIQRDTGWRPSSRTHRLLSGSGAEHAAVWRDGAAVDPLHVARQHLDLPPWGRQTRESREGITSGSAGPCPCSPLPFPRGNTHGAGGFLWADPKLATPSCTSQAPPGRGWLCSVSQDSPLLPV